jgi:hypothetical protein
MWKKFESSIWNNIGSVGGHWEYNIFRCDLKFVKTFLGT